jgi:hypothetical protein
MSTILDETDGKSPSLWHAIVEVAVGEGALTLAGRAVDHHRSGSTGEGLIDLSQLVLAGDVDAGEDVNVPGGNAQVKLSDEVFVSLLVNWAIFDGNDRGEPFLMVCAAFGEVTANCRNFVDDIRSTYLSPIF